MKQWALCCVAIVIMAMGAIPAGAQAPLVLFENFEGKFFDPAKWFGTETAPSGMVILEGARQMKTEPTYQYRGLYLLDRAHANTANDSGASTALNRLFFTDGSNIRTIQASVQVKKLQNTLCATNTTPNIGRVRFGGFYFNTDIPTPGSSLNDVFAYVAVGRGSDSIEPANVLTLVGRVHLCIDASCFTTTPIGEVELGTVKVNQKVKLRITWDPDNDQFIFQKGKGEEFLVSYAPLSDANPPGSPNGGNKRFEVQNILANCTDDVRPWGHIDAFFDNIYIDEPPAPGL
jgi:hypothetical protein